jgi:hypothetical protein
LGATFAEGMEGGHVKTPEQKQRELGAWHREWEEKWRHTIVVDETYAHDGQYAETIADMSASAEAEDDYWQGVRRIYEP